MNKYLLKKIFNSVIFGFMIFSLTFSLVVAGIIIISVIEGIKLSHHILEMACVRGVKSGLVPGIALAIVSSVGWPRRPSGGR